MILDLQGSAVLTDAPREMETKLRATRRSRGSGKSRSCAMSLFFMFSEAFQANLAFCPSPGTRDVVARRRPAGNRYERTNGARSVRETCAMSNSLATPSLIDMDDKNDFFQMKEGKVEFANSKRVEVRREQIESTIRSGAWQDKHCSDHATNSIRHEPVNNDQAEQVTLYDVTTKRTNLRLATPNTTLEAGCTRLHPPLDPHACERALPELRCIARPQLVSAQLGAAQLEVQGALCSSSLWCPPFRVSPQECGEYPQAACGVCPPQPTYTPKLDPGDARLN